MITSKHENKKTRQAITDTMTKNKENLQNLKKLFFSLKKNVIHKKNSKTKVRFVLAQLNNPLVRFYTKKHEFDSPSKRFNNNEIECKTRRQRRLSFILWCLFIFFWSYCIYAFIKIKFYVLLVCLFHAVMDSFANGLIDFVCQLDANYRENELKRKRLPIKQD